MSSKIKNIIKRLLVGVLLAGSLLLENMSFNLQSEAHIHNHEHIHHHHVHDANGEENTPTIQFRKKEYTFDERNNFNLQVDALNLKCAGLEVEIHYDSNIFDTPSGVYNDVPVDAAKLEFFTCEYSKPGIIKATYVFKDDKTINGDLFYFYLPVKNVDHSSNTYLDIMVGNVIDSKYNQVHVHSKGSYAKIVAEDHENRIFTTQHTCSFNKRNFQKDDTVIYSVRRYSGHDYASAEIQIEYDRDLLEFSSLSFRDTLINATKDVNTNIKGAVFITFIVNRETYFPSYADLFDVRFKVLKDTSHSISTNIVTKFNSLNTVKYEKVVSPNLNSEINIEPTTIKPKAPLIYTNDVSVDSAFEFNINLFIEGKANLGAADLYLHFVPDCLELVSAKVSEIPDVLLGVNTNKAAQGIVRYSVLSTQGINDTLCLGSLKLKAKDKYYEGFTNLHINAKNLTDPLTKPIKIETQDSLIGLNKHIHKFSAWETTLPETCVTDGQAKRVCLCGESETRKLPATGHSFGSWVVGKASTCLEKGYTIRTCRKCGKEERNETPLADHTWGERSITEAPTCTKEGSQHRICSLCGKEETKRISKLPHNLATREEQRVEPTCTENGSYLLVTYCLDCKQVISSETRTISAKGHDFSGDWVIDKEPTCTESGIKSLHCNNPDCNERIQISTIPPKGHAWGNWEVNRAPSCASSGEEKRTCATCGEVEYRHISSTGHHFSTEWTIDKEPNCIETGLKSHHCLNPGCDVKIDVTILPALGHKFDKWETVKEPTCTTNGQQKAVCTVCGMIEYREITATGHTFEIEWTIDKAPTCTDPGYKSHHCINKDCTARSEITEIPALGHKLKTKIIDSKDSTCLEEGYQVEVTYCEICGIETDRHTIYKPPLEHNWSNDYIIDIEPTCTDWGECSLHCLNPGCTERMEIRPIEPLGHQYVTEIQNRVEPTCDTDGSYDEVTYCTRCQEIISSEHHILPSVGHIVSEEWTIDRAPTCTLPGEKSHHCTNENCDYRTDITTIEPTGHNWTEWEVVTQATFEGDGLKQRKCLTCNELETQIIPAKKHNLATREENRVEATCAREGGYDIVTYCKDCNEVISTEHITIKKLAHTLKTRKENEVQATCTTPGSYDLVTYCEVCNEVISRKKVETDKAKGHTLATRKEDVVEASCTSPGSYTLVTYCSECGEVIERQHVNVDKLPHEWSEWTTTKDPTCNEAGERKRVCSVCGETEVEVIPPTEHKLSTRHDNVVEATCTTPGSYDLVIYCTDCGKVISSEHKDVPALEHKYSEEWTIDKAPTCTEPGSKSHHCLNDKCDSKIDETIIAPLGHKWSEWEVINEASCTKDGKEKRTCATCNEVEYRVIKATGHDVSTRRDNIVDPTCTNPGSYDLVIYCKTCGKVINTEHMTINATGHKRSDEWTIDKAPTCTEPGSKSHHCINPNCSEKNFVTEIPATGHKRSSWELTKSASCKETGLMERTCSICGQTEKRVIPTTNHIEATRKESIVEATCTEDGSYVLVTYCSSCGDIISKTTVKVKAFGHNFSSEWTIDEEATCKHAGSKSHHCTNPNCHEKIDITEIPMLKHAWTKWEIKLEATTENDGLMERRCPICGEVETKVIPATKHIIATREENRVEPTCKNVGGYDVVTYCSKCGKVLETKHITLDKLEHKITTRRENVKGPTCKEPGSYELVTYCENCGEVINRENKTEGEPLGHTLATKKDNIVLATCELEGRYDLVTYCKVCGEEISRQTIVTEKAPHSYGNWTITLNPTCNAEGEETRTCSVCGAIETRKISKVDHKLSTREDNRIEPTCDKVGGYDLVTYCYECGTVIKSEHITIDKLSHTLITRVENEKAATCLERGSYTQVTYCSKCGKIINKETIYSTPALGHEIVETREDIIEPTCKQEGSYILVKTCSRCHEEISRETVITAKLEHNWGNWSTEVEPSCSKEGREKRVCSLCGEVEYRNISMTKHTIATKEENRIEPTCLKTGSYDLVEYCSVCGKEISRKTITLEKLTHNLVTKHEDLVEPTCTTKGSYIEVTYCSLCGKEVKRETVYYAPALGHTEATRIENEVKATCKENGSYELVTYCSICNKEIKRETKVTPKLKHEWSEWVLLNGSTCTTKGREQRTCSLCGQVEYRELPLVNHTISTKVENKVDATCEHAGGYDIVTYCTTCEKEISRQHFDLPQLKHNLVTKHENEVEATCTTNGSYELVTYCSICNKEISREKVISIPALGHNEATRIENRVEPTCSKEGSYVLVTYCTRCNEVIKRETKTIAKASHNWGEWILDTNSTCSVHGKEKRVCSICGEIEYRDLPLAPHELVTKTVDRIEATCEENGSYYEVTYCKNCGKEISRVKRIIYSKGHTWSDEWTVDVEPTCTTPGSKSHHCTNPNCDAKTDVRKILPLEHTWSEWKITKEPTHETEGEETRTCSICGHSETRKVDKLSYNKDFMDAVLALNEKDSKEDQLKAIKHAYDLYQKVVNKDEVSNYYQLLKDFVKKYNESLVEMNEVHKQNVSLTSVMLNVGALSLTTLGLYLALKRRF